jgi:hypothetical protein
MAETAPAPEEIIKISTPASASEVTADIDWNASPGNALNADSRDSTIQAPSGNEISPARERSKPAITIPWSMPLSPRG